jgi:diguanylate cyclase (GGDEF)-like protein
MAEDRHTRELDIGAKSWLCRSDFDRQRMLDMEDRVRPVRQRAGLIVALTILAAGPWLGWWPLVFVVAVLSCFSFADRLMPRMTRPELLMFTAWVCSALTIALAVALSGRLGTPALAWLSIPVMTLSTRFPIRGVIVGVTISIALALAVAFTIDLHQVLADPVLVLVPVALILCVAVLSTPLMQSDIQHRSDAVIDQLTGMLNRTALAVRVQELTQQASVTGEPVGLIVGDVDNFKTINDTHGHATGDAVLKQVAYALRKQLRAFDLAYRLGGEEFLIVLPGAELHAAAELAERLREAVAAAPMAGGVSVTMSLGVSGSLRGQPFDYESVFADGDAALYRAKRGGRDRVVCSGYDTRAPAFA